MPPIIKPRGLHKGDAISVVVPAGPVNRERIDRALARLGARGFRTKTYGDIYRSRGYLAGDDATRAAEFLAAFADPETTAVWCARGGYGVMRLLDRIDFDIILRNP
jgi:muramoyltetrapeptide carboxypeptidase